MEGFLYDFLIVGGDLRLSYLAEDLSRKGYRVGGFGMVQPVSHNNCTHPNSLFDAMKQAKIIIGPIPFSRNQKQLNCSNQSIDIHLSVFTNLLSRNHQFFAGCIPPHLIAVLKEKKIPYYDFMKDDSITIFNSIATAEGIIAKAIMEYPSNLHNSNILIMGYGHCAKTMAQKLKHLTKTTTVCARSHIQCVQASAMGFETLDFNHLLKHLGEFDLIFNSIPAPVLNEKELLLLKPSAMIFDIASAPGGIDFEKAKELKIQASLYPGLPGICAPQSSAEILSNYILKTLKQNGEK